MKIFFNKKTQTESNCDWCQFYTVDPRVNSEYDNFKIGKQYSGIHTLLLD
jgi:hypothetical protein